MPISTIDEIHNDFMVYAKAVNEDRAFPDVRDGLKPSQRACLWEMLESGYSSNKPHVKSAKVDGGVIARWHPHGSVYETFGRMSQNWVNNIPEVDWHGANGSLLGGPELAASRYTECRLSKASEDGLFMGIKKNAVDMQLNFSEDLEWPTVFPAIFPRLFVNGSQGIGYTIAQEWELGNLNEFTDKVKEYLKTKKVDCSNIYPDYPTAGIIVNKSDIHTIYETGKGPVVLRGKTEIDNNIIKITSLPYQVYVEPFIANIKELVNSNKLTGIEDIYNKSDDSGMLIEIECSEDPHIVLNLLYKLTDLQCTFSANQMALVNGKPELLTLKEYIKIYLEHNLNCIKREYEFDLDKAQARKEIVEGLLKALNNIDNIINTIKAAKSSESAKSDLMTQYGFTKNQAQAIVDMRLGKLANLEQVELNDENSELDKTIKNCNKLINSTKEQEKEFIKRLEAFTSKYGWERRTEVIDIDIKEEKQKVIKKIKTIEQTIICLCDDGGLKKLTLAEYRSGKSNIVKAVKVNSTDKPIVITDSGKMYKLQVSKIQKGTMKSSGINPIDENIVNIFSGKEEEPYLFFITDKGKVKKTETSNVFCINKNTGTPVMKLDNEKIIWVNLVTDDKVKVQIGKKATLLDTTKFRPKGRSAGGQKGLRLKENEQFKIEG